MELLRGGGGLGPDFGGGGELAGQLCRLASAVARADAVALACAAETD